MNTLLHEEYRRLRAEHGYDAKQSHRVAAYHLAERTRQVLLGTDKVRAQLLANWPDVHHFTVAGVAFEVRIEDDPDGGYDDLDDYRVDDLGRYYDWEGWGRDGRQNGEVVIGLSNDGYRRVTLPEDLRLDACMWWWRRQGMSKQAAFERACQQQDGVKQWLECRLGGDIGYVGYQLFTLDGEGDVDEELDSCWGFDGVEHMVDDCILPAIYHHLAKQAQP